MIIVTREYKVHPANGGYKELTEFKFFADDDVEGIQKYVDEHDGAYSFKKL